MRIVSNISRYYEDRSSELVTMIKWRPRYLLLILTLLVFIAILFSIFLFCTYNNDPLKNIDDHEVGNGNTVGDLVYLAKKYAPKINLEARAIRLAEDLLTDENNLNSNVYRKHSNSLLCTVFSRWGLSNINNILENIRKSEGLCDWVVIVYSYDENTKDLVSNTFNNGLQNLHSAARTANKNVTNVTVIFPSFRDAPLDGVVEVLRKYDKYGNLSENQFSYISQVLGIKLKREDHNATLLDIYYHNHLPSNDLVVSKALLYLKLLEYAEKYNRVWILDGDISLSNNFKMSAFLNTLSCAFSQKITIGQPLIKGASQTYKYLNSVSWENRKGVIASETGFIEIQSPIFDTEFFIWFVVSFVSPLLIPSFVLGGDWGFDSLFCKSAMFFEFAKQVRGKLNRTSSKSPTELYEKFRSFKLHKHRCALITESIVDHSSKKEINGFLGYNVKVALNKVLIEIISSSLPSFTYAVKGRKVDPLHPKSTFKKVYKRRENCSYFH